MSRMGLISQKQVILNDPKQVKLFYTHRRVLFCLGLHPWLLLILTMLVLVLKQK